MVFLPERPEGRSFPGIFPVMARWRTILWIASTSRWSSSSEKTPFSGKLPYVPDGAILALWPGITAADLQEALTSQEKLLYEMIRLRTLASRMRAAEGQSIVCALQCGNYAFEATDQQIEEKGYLAAGAHQGEKFPLGESALFQVAQGQAIAVAEVRCENTSLYPPEPYTFETLFADLADFSITVDDNLVLMLQFMMEAGYVDLEATGFLKPLDNCRKVVNVLNRVFPSMQGVNLSAYMEQTAEEVISGRKALASALQQIDQVLSVQGKPLITPSISAATLSTLQKKRQGRVSRNVIKTEAMAAEKELPAVDAEDGGISQPGAGEKAPARAGSLEVLEEEEFQAAAETAPETPSPAENTEESELLAQRSESKGEKEGADLQERDDGETAGERIFSAALQQVEEESSKTPAAGGAGDPAAAETAEDGAGEADPFTEHNHEPDAIPPTVGSAMSLPTAVPLGEEERARSRPCPVCGRPMVLGRDQFGRFYTCTGFPACRYAEPEKSGSQVQMSCPVCAKGVVHVKTTPTGKMLYVCSEVDCEFMAWAKPHPVACPSCGSPFLVEKKLPSGVAELRCPRAGCNYRQPFLTAAENTADGRTEDRSVAPKKKVLVRRVAGAASTSGGKKRVVRVVRRRK